MSTEVKVDLTIDAVNDVPVAVTDSYTTPEETLLRVDAAKGLLANDSDPDGDSLSVLLDANPTHGKIQFNLDGSFTYLPEFNFNGTDFFTYKVTDGHLESQPSTVKLEVRNVNDAPLAAHDSYSTPEDTLIKVDAAHGVLVNDLDFDGDILTAHLLSPPSSGVLHFSKDGSFDYAPTNNFNGTDSFTYKAYDGSEESSIVTVTIDVHAVNDAPVASDDTYSIGEDGFLKVLFDKGLLNNDQDADGNTLQVNIVSTVNNGDLQMNLDGSFTYKPYFGFHGPDSFSYMASDGKVDSNKAKVTIQVNHVNHPPLPNGDTYSTSEGGILKILAANGLLANDLDIDGDTLLVTDIPKDVSHGSLQMMLDGSFTYIPEPGYSGSDSFTYTVNDGSVDMGPVTVNLKVNHVNHEPLAAADTYSLAQNTTLTVPAKGLLANDLDIDGDQLMVLLQSYPNHGALHQDLDGGFTYLPAPEFEGIDSYTYIASDGALNSKVVKVTLNVHDDNHPPLAGADSYSTPRDTLLQVDAGKGVLSNDIDPDNNALTATIVGHPRYGTVQLEKEGSFKYTPNAGYAGLDSFTYQASDGASKSSVTAVTIDVNFTNRAPLAADDAYTTNRDTVLQIDAPNGLLINDADPDSDILSVAIVGQPQHGSLHVESNGSFKYTPAINYAGQDGFSYKVSDGQLESNEVTVTITVHQVNHPPVAVDDTYHVDQNTLLTVNPKGVLSNDVDIDGNSLKSFVVTGPARGNFVFNPDGSFTYKPNTDFTGTDSFTYKVFDGKDYSSPGKVTIIVNPIYRLRVHVFGQGWGRVTGGLTSVQSVAAANGTSIACPGDCEASFPSGTTARLSAYLDTDVTRGSWSWSGACPDNEPSCDYKMDTDQSASVVFTCDQIDIPAHTLANSKQVATHEPAWICNDLRASQGFAIVAPDGEISFIAGNSITLGSGFRVELGGVFHGKTGQAIP